MPRKKKDAEFTLGPKTKELFDVIRSTLENRGANDFNVGEIIESLVCENSGGFQQIVNKFVSDKTPQEYKLKKLLADEAYAKEVEKLTKKHNFGMSLSAE